MRDTVLHSAVSFRKRHIHLKPFQTNNLLYDLLTHKNAVIHLYFSDVSERGWWKETRRMPIKAISVRMKRESMNYDQRAAQCRLNEMASAVSEHWACQFCISWLA